MILIFENDTSHRVILDDTEDKCNECLLDLHQYYLAEGFVSDTGINSGNKVDYYECGTISHALILSNALQGYKSTTKQKH